MRIPDLEVLRRRGTMKWTTYPDDVLPMFVAESDFDTCDAVAAAIADGVERQYFGYASKRDTSVQDALAGVQAGYGWEVDPAGIRLCPDVVKGVAVCVDALTAPGSGVVITRPSYYPFFDIPTVTNRPAVYVDMVEREGEWGYDYDALERAFASGTVGSMIVCHPYNPLGRVFRTEELERLVDLAVQHGVRLISDEIHAPIVYPGATFRPLASISDAAAAVTVTVTASSKGWNTAGLHCAQIITSNPEDRRIIMGLHNLVVGEASTLGALAAAAAYRDGQAWLRDEVEYLSANLDLLIQRIPEVMPGASVRRPEATYLLWVDLRDATTVSGRSLASKPAAMILEDARVALSEGEVFGPQGVGHVRWNVATSRELLSMALDRIGDM